MPLVITTLVGSLRQGSLNRKLAEASRALVPADVTLDVVGIDGIPVYNGDDEDQHGPPPAVVALKERIVASDALLIVSPEYNNSIPGPLKNAIDWVSRPPKDTARVFGGRPVGVIGASPGRNGALLAQQAWLPVLRALGVAPYFGGALTVGGASTVFADDGTIADAGTRDRVAADRKSVV